MNRLTLLYIVIPPILMILIYLVIPLILTFF